MLCYTQENDACGENEPTLLICQHLVNARPRLLALAP
jgi:hypothetical protein